MLCILAKLLLTFSVYAINLGREALVNSMKLMALASFRLRYKGVSQL